MYGQLKQIVDRIDEIEGVFPGHGPIDMDPVIITDIYQAVREIVENPQGYDFITEREMFGKKQTLCSKLFNRSDTINYSL